jgi:N-terminal 7TM region of histidine kinase
VNEIGLTAATHIGLSALLTSVTTAALGSFVLVKNRRSNLYRVFSLYSFSIALWSGFVALHIFTENRQFAILTGKYLHIGAVFIPVMFVHFVSEFFGDRKHIINRTFLTVLYLIAGGFVVLCINGTLISDVAPK